MRRDLLSRVKTCTQLQYPDLEMIVEQLDEDDRRRHRALP